VAGSLCENARLREENQALREQAIWSRRNARYYKRMHRKASEKVRDTPAAASSDSLLGDLKTFHTAAQAKE